MRRTHLGRPLGPPFFLWLFGHYFCLPVLLTIRSLWYRFASSTDQKLQLGFGFIDCFDEFLNACDFLFAFATEEVFDIHFYSPSFLWLQEVEGRNATYSLVASGDC